MKLGVKLVPLPQLAFLVCQRTRVREVCLEIHQQDLERHPPLDRNQQLDLEHLVLMKPSVTI